ncbi:MAG: tetratricopeptide repeat protein [Thermoanaerobaculia bacterium]
MAARRQIEEQAGTVQELLAGGEARARDLGAAVGALGRLYHSYGLEDSAAGCYLEAERLDPDNARWPYYLGFLHQVRGEAGDAAEALSRALRLTPNDPPTLVRLARARLELGQIENAEDLFRRSLEHHPSAAAAAHAGLARIGVARNQHRLAAEHYESALAIQPQATRLHYPLALAYKELGETAQAEEHLLLRGDAPVAFPDPLAAALDSTAIGAALHLERAGIALAEGRREEAVAEYRRALATDPDNANARGDLGTLLAAAGDLSGAVSELQEAHRLEPNNPIHVESLARVLATGGAEEKALPLFRRAAELDPARAAGHLHLAAALARTGRYLEARDSFDRALELDPASAAARLGRAEVQLEVGRPAAAAADLETVLESEPDNARASLRLGEARQRLGEVEAALTAFEAALGGGLDPPERTAALLGTGNLLAARGDLAAAVTRYREALALMPGLDQAEFNLAGALTMLGREEEAIGHYAALLERDPANLRTRAYRAQLLLGRGRAAAAVRDFDYILAREPSSSAAHLGVAAALQVAGLWSEARRRLEEAVARLPGEPLVSAALARLLASCPDPALRDGERAIQLAEALLAADRSPDHAETLAMALAAAERYDEAAELQRELLDMARSTGAPAGLVGRLGSNLALYEASLPCCAAPSS